MYYSIKAAKPQVVSDILRFAQSDIMPYGIVIFLPSAKVILYSPLTDRIAITLGRSPNITAKQYHSPKANITEKTLVQKEQEFFLAPTVGLEPTTTRLTAAGSTD